MTFKGDELFEENVLIPLERDMKILEETVYTKISEVKTEMLISIAQLEKIRKEINHTFNETLNKVS